MFSFLLPFVVSLYVRFFPYMFGKGSGTTPPSDNSAFIYGAKLRGGPYTFVMVTGL